MVGPSFDIIGLIIVLSVTALIFFGCGGENKEEIGRSQTTTITRSIWKKDNVRIFFYRGHEYLVYGRGGIIHSQSCGGKHEANSN